VNLAIELSDALVDELAERVQAMVETDTVWRDLDGTANAFQTTTRQIRYWREQGAPAKKIGRKLWFNLRELEEWIERQ
jgi:hypothetical protein